MDVASVSRSRRAEVPNLPNAPQDGILAGLVLTSRCLFIDPGSAQDTPTNPGHTWRDPNVSARYRNWLREGVYIVTDQEREDFKSLASDKQRDDFIIAFWERRNPNPGSPENTFKEEQYRRIAYTDEHFAAGIPGWKTNRRRIYIIYGAPDSVESHPGFLPPIQIWHYAFLKGCTNVVLTFTHKDGHGGGDHSSERCRRRLASSNAQRAKVH